MITKNRCYTNPVIIKPTGIMIHSVGCSQPRKEVFINNWNNQSASVSVHAICDMNGIEQLLPYNYKAWHCGKSANNTHIAIEITEPTDLKYNKFGQVESCFIPGSYIHFKSCKDQVVNWAAEICLDYNIDVKNIISHEEGYKLGIASNHADVKHWWKYHNYTMDDFRNEVSKLLQSYKRYNSLDEIPDSYKVFVKVLIDKNIVRGNKRGELDLTLDMIRNLIFTGRMVGWFD